MVDRPQHSTHLASRFTVTTGPRSVMHLHGELDLASTPRLQEALDARSRPISGGLVIDLSELTFASCAGLAVLFSEHLRRRAANSSLLLIAPTAGLRHILSVTDLDAALNIRTAGAAAI